MSKKLSRNDALENISTWSTNDVLCLLRKNGLEECCTAVSKRQIDGDELLHLTEGKLALWKSDLTRSLIWELRTLVEKVKKFPERFVQEKNVETEQNEDHMSDTSSWDTDFEDEIPEDNPAFTDTRNINVDQINSNYENDHTISKRTINVNADAQVDDNTKRQDEETTYANFESTLDTKTVYANHQDNVTNLPPKNVSRLHGTVEKTLAEQLKEQLQLRNSKKPVLRPKPELISKRLPNVSTAYKQPQKSFLHDESKTKTRLPNDAQRRMTVPPPPAPKKNDQSFSKIGKNDKDASKPSISIKNLDLIANLPTRQDESEDEYEKFDEQIIEQNQKSIISRIDSKQSLTCGPQSSVESVYQPSSTTSCEEEEEPYEIYESITETPEDNDNYLSPIQKPPNSGNTLPPPLPIKLPTTPPPTLHRTKPNNANG
ncbi:putative mediator of RNA polymerase II transcription subunit 26 isoform X1 [Vespula squamosa]|uniref:Mediator of RNA polymerase II transcription subunit 26 isoform X1 n=1 Tax=Vespula squamosa TaxID=30214 RepID=A0ABD2AXG2_VESSQ